ncbi:MAG TPA: hypothetical protein VH395_00940 [Jatrophihabitantaceae bacterium]
MASTGSTGGFSPGRVFGPIRGTSAGTAGTAGAVGAATRGVVLPGAGAELLERGAADDAVDVAVEEEGGVCAAVALQAAQHNAAATARASARRIGT